MTAWQTFKSLIAFQPAPPAITAKSAPSGVEYIGPNGQRAADWSGVNQNPALSRSYRLCATAYACATFLADAVSEAPLRVYRIQDGDLIEQPNHRLRRLLTNPNPVQSESELMGLTVMTMAMFGYAVVEKVRSAGNIPVELWPLRPDWLKAEKRSDGSNAFVYRKPSTDARVIADDDLIFIPYRHDERQLQIGVSPLQVVAREVGIDVSLTDLLKVFIDAGGIPPWVIKVPDSEPDQADVDVFREKWSQMYGGWGAYQNVGIIYGDMEITKIGDSIGDMAWPDLRGLVEMKIAQAFRVPADLIQARDSMKSGSLTTTEIDGAMGALQAFGATPLRARIDGAFTRGLLPDFVGGDPNYTIEFDTSEILSMQEDRDALHNRVRADFDAGTITLNQYLNETGRPEIGKTGDVYKVAFTTMYVPATALVDTEPAPAALPKSTIREIAAKSERQYVDRKGLTEPEAKARANYLAQTNRNRQKLTQIGSRKLKAFFREQGERVVAALPEKSADGVELKLSQVFSWAEEDELLGDLMDRYYNEVGKSAFNQVSGVTGDDLVWSVQNQHVASVMDDLGGRITGITETTQTDVQKLIADGLADGKGYQELGKDISHLFEETYKGRAETIARTESMVAYNQASIVGYDLSGSVDEVELVDNVDHTDDYGASDGLTCAERDGIRVNLSAADEDGENILQGHIDAEHPNGSLAVIPILNRQLGE